MMLRGETWGTPTTRHIEDIVVKGDSALAAQPPDHRLIATGGDLAHSLGFTTIPEVGHACTEVPIDGIQIDLEMKNGQSKTVIGASSVSIGSWFLGRFVCITNSGFIDARNVAPRAHPNDGFLDVMALDTAMTLQQRIRARQKSLTGTHIPHPQINVSRSRHKEYTKESFSDILSIDGHKVLSWQRVTIQILPDYWRLLV